MLFLPNKAILLVIKENIHILKIFVLFKREDGLNIFKYLYNSNFNLYVSKANFPSLQTL